jgi:vesicle-fusing ATPase
MEFINLSAIRKATSMEPKSSTTPNKHGFILDTTTIQIVKPDGSQFPLTSGEKPATITLNIDPSSWDFDDIGIGGLNNEVTEIFRRAFLPRLLPPHVRKNWKIPYVRGIILYGPPGTGKTLIARKIADKLTGKEPKRISGPEIFHWLVGKAEEKVRELFVEAEKDEKELKEKSPLHLIVFDEIDAIAKKRGLRNDGTNVADNVVNQLLSKMDGPNQLNNILVIGTTNRLDLIDEAVLRPRRFDVHIPVGLPDEKGRKEIFLIHTKSMREAHLLSPSINLDYCAARTKNFTGAEIEGLVGEAQSFAFSRKVKDLKNIGDGIQDAESIILEPEDMEKALAKTVPAFGADDMEFDHLLEEELISHGPQYDAFQKEMNIILQQLKQSDKTPFITVLLHGRKGVGKTTLLANIAKQAGFSYAKFVTATSLLNLAIDDHGKCNQLLKVFHNAYLCDQSALMIDDLEKIVEYVSVGPRYSPAILQTLSVMMDKKPPPGKKLLIVASCTDLKLIQALGLASIFNYTFEVPTVLGVENNMNIVKQKWSTLSESEAKDITTSCNQKFVGGVPVKKLLLALENATFAHEKAEKLVKLINSSE